MTTFTFTTNDATEAMVMMNALVSAGVDVKAATTPIVIATDTVDKANETTVSSDADTTETVSTPYTVGQVQAALNKMCAMTSDELVDTFGFGNDKPYRVIKNVGLENAIKTLDAGSEDVDGVSLDDVLNAIQYIVKDVSVGGMSHDEMEDLFDVRTSKNLFKENTLKEIVRVLKENDMI